MRLEENEYYQYLDIHRKLIYYTGRRMDLFTKGLSFDDFLNFTPNEKYPVRNALYDNIHLLDDFIKEHPELSEDDKGIIRGFKHFKKGSFYIAEYTKEHTIFLGDDYAYGVLALNDPIQSFFGNNLPVLAKAVLLPINGRIIYDGMLSSMPVRFGRGITMTVKNDLAIAKARYGVITQLPEKVSVSRLREGKERELLAMMKTKASREYNEYEIQELLEENPFLLPVYNKEWGRINTRYKKKSIKELGIKKRHFAIYKDTVIASAGN